MAPPAARHDAEEPEAWSRCEQNRRRDPWRWHDLQLWTSPAAGNKQTNKEKKNKQSYKQPKLIIFMKQVLHQVSNTITTTKHRKLWSSSVSRKNIPTISPPPGCIQQPKTGLLPQPAVQDHLLRAQRPLHLKWICTDGEIVLDVCTGACHNLTQIRFSNVVDPGTWWHSFQ